MKHEGKATIYYGGGLGSYAKLEVRSVEVDRIEYAQYANAVRVRLIAKGARKVRGFVQTYEPNVIVIEGHGHPDAPGLFGEAKVSNGVEVRESRRLMCDPGWDSEFREFIEAHLAASGGRVLYDATKDEPVKTKGFVY